MKKDLRNNLIINYQQAEDNSRKGRQSQVAFSVVFGFLIVNKYE